MFWRERSGNNLILPALAPVYSGLGPYMEPLLRVVTGLWLIPHGWPKLMNLGNTAESFSGMGFEPGILWGSLVALTEVFGGFLIAIGLLTRPAAFAAMVFLLTATAFHWNNGFFWSDGGFEYPLLWAIACLFFVIRGGGLLSVDRAIGREI